MKLTDKPTIKGLLKRYGTKAEKYLGQHFILSKKALVQIVAAAEIKKNDTIIEIGPGLGTLTQELAKTGAKIIAIEKDPSMISILEETLADFKNIKIVQADVRNLKISEIYKSGDKMGIIIEKGGYKIVANLPFNIATFLIRQWLELKNSPKLMVLMIQKEVAQRICAKPRLRQGCGGQAPMNLLAASVQFYADAKIINYVSAEAFWPRPKVSSVIIKIIPKEKLPQKTRDAFFAVVKAGFSQPRKQLIGNLAKKLSTKGETSPKGGKIPREKLMALFKSLNISERARAENLSLEQWYLLAKSL